jgi:RNA polymerase sigma-70 factor (ECF subfamily)
VAIELQKAPVSFEGIYRAHLKDVLRWIRMLGGPESEREDIAQDVFLTVHRRLCEFDGENTPGWLYQITRHRVADVRRLRWVRLFLRKQQVDESLASTREGPDGSLLRRDEERFVSLVLDRLPETQRTTFVLFELEGLSGEEIARHQGVSLSTVWVRIYRARAKMSENVRRMQRDDR